MPFAAKEASRDRSNPAKLFLFRGADPALESLLRSVTMGPGLTEFGLGTTLVSALGPIADTDPVVMAPIGPKNYYAGTGVSDFEQSLRDLIAAAPGLRNVSLVVAWHASDLRAANCTIRPKVETATITTAPYDWRVGGLTRAAAQVVSQHDGRPALGGAPSDRSIYEAIATIKARGLRCTLHPVLVMDIPLVNGLPNPYGGNNQPAYPWRGRLTAEGADDIATFFGGIAPSAFTWNASDMRVEWGPTASAIWDYRKFILHMATIANAAGVDDFLIGSDLVGLTRVQDEAGGYPAVERLRGLATACRAILGATVRISYSADWSEYHSRRSGNTITFNMDRLWSHADIDFIGINNYMPMSDWRSGFSHLDWRAGFSSLHDISYLQSNIEGGELYDWTYPNSDARDAQNRVPVVDNVHQEPWVWRLKDIRGWWANAHHNRVAGVRQASPTAWVPKSKPIVFTEIGCPSVDKGPNQPGAIRDFKSSDNRLPYYSTGRIDGPIMRAFLEAAIRYWSRNNEAGFIEVNSITAWGWDVRPYPAFPDRTSVWSDTRNWRGGPWLTGHLAPGRSFESGTFGNFAFTDAEHPIVRDGITYEPWPIKHSDITASGTLDNSEITVTMANSRAVEASPSVTAFIDAFVGYPPSQVINLTIFQGQMDDTPSLVEYPAVWLGRVNAPQWDDNEIQLSCMPVSTSIQRPGLRRNYQVGCPHVLYGSQCRASKRGNSLTRPASSVNRNVITVGGADMANSQYFRGGMVEWTGPSGMREVRTILNATANTLTVRGTVKGIGVGTQLSISRGCDHSLDQCRNVFQNVLNFGGQPMIPLDNPLSQKNQFY